MDRKDSQLEELQVPEPVRPAIHGLVVGTLLQPVQGPHIVVRRKPAVVGRQRLGLLIGETSVRRIQPPRNIVVNRFPGRWSPKVALFLWMASEVLRRIPEGTKSAVFLSDEEHALHEHQGKFLPEGVSHPDANARGPAVHLPRGSPCGSIVENKCMVGRCLVERAHFRCPRW
jgi:hypothetical protein